MLKMGGMLRDTAYLVRAKPIDPKRHLINMHDKHRLPKNEKLAN